MLLKTLYLKNIRSYIEETINFPEGIVLLAGDIGSGKSTILLAIEFALFGILRGELSGSALLRNNAREGKVELTFELENHTYTIGRTLKRTKTGIEQEAGYIVHNNLRQEMTALELKSKILQLLGYPEELITKSKSLIYRYTVYTPQEEMKRIITENKESRLGILRKVFDIEKYRRISENANTYSRVLRERKREIEGQLLDEHVKQQQLKEKQEQSRIIQQSLLEIQPKLNLARQKAQQQKTILDKLENERALVARLRENLQAAEAELKAHTQHRQFISAELAKLEQTSLPPQSIQEITNALQQKKQSLLHFEHELKTHITMRGELTATARLAENTLKRILELDECPVCLQKVEASHKHKISQQEAQKKQALLSQLTTLQENLSRKEKDKQQLQQEILALEQQKIQAEQALQDQQRKQQLQTTLIQLNNTIASAESRKTQALAALQKHPDLEKIFLEEKQKLDTIQRQEQALVVEHAKLLEQAKHLRETITVLEQELAEKQKARAQLEQLNKLNHWLDEFFNNLMSTIEKHALAKVYHDFNTIFQQWFNLLIQDENLQARLDEEFTPVVQQNGYDTEIENLSGGEKTACALAYRLALNKAINELRPNIKTRNIIILDEPTDGFSTDQISRMRELLKQAKARQIILVSHEAMIETLADNILRVVKEEHTSKVLV